MFDDPNYYRALADGVLVLHAGLVVFVVGGLLLILLGAARKWMWVRNFWFRVLHLAAIASVVLESWLGIVCPLTTFELWLRQRAGQLVYEGDFIAYWLGKAMFYQAPPWVFIALYSVFALLVAGTWLLVPPTAPPRRRRRTASGK